MFCFLHFFKYNVLQHICEMCNRGKEKNCQSECLNMNHFRSGFIFRQTAGLHLKLARHRLQKNSSNSFGSEWEGDRKLVSLGGGTLLIHKSFILTQICFNRNWNRQILLKRFLMLIDLTSGMSLRLKRNCLLFRVMGRAAVRNKTPPWRD